MRETTRVRDVKLIKIGNSKGVRLPKAILQKYAFSDSLLLEETDKGVLLRQKGGDKLSWEETYKEMANEQEDWGDFEVTLFDGLKEEEFDTEKI